MKYVWFGLSILALLLALCLFTTSALDTCASETARTLLQAERACLQGEEEQALALSQRAKQQWDSHETLFGAVLCHDETDTVREEFVQLLSYASTDSREDFLCSCHQLIDLLDHLPRMEQLYWYNLL